MNVLCRRAEVEGTNERLTDHSRLSQFLTLDEEGRCLLVGLW